MKPFLKILAAALLLAGAAASAEPPDLRFLVASKKTVRPEATPTPAPAAPTLRWKNGESVPGELVSATKSALTWKTPLFEDPLVLNWHALRRIDQTLPPVFPPDAFGFVLRDGGHLSGDLVSISATGVSIHSARHGDAELKRSEILSIRRLYSDQLVYAGPVGDAGWELKTENDNNNARQIRGIPPVPSLTIGPGGALSIPFWNRRAALAVKIPSKVEIEFRLRSSKRPDFAVALERDGAPPVRLETWDDELVVAAGDQFLRVGAVTEEQRELALHFCWDGVARKSAVYGASGELLAEWSVPEGALPADPTPAPAGSGRTLILNNKGRDLTLEWLRVQQWDGQPLQKFDARKPRVELVDGRVIEGAVTESAEGVVGIRAEGAEGAGQSVPLAQVAAVIFSPDPPQPKEGPFTLTYADGTLLRGQEFSVANGQGKLSTPVAGAPLSTRMEGLRQVKLQVPAPEGTPPEPPLTDLDKVVIGKTELHGRLASADDALPRWQPLGGLAPALPSREALAEITRGFAADAAFPSASALFYTAGGDVLPGRLRSLDRSGVELESPLIKVTKLPAEYLDAVQFSIDGKVSVQGFSDPAWRILQGDEKSIRRKGASLEMDAETSLAHPYAMQAGEIDFKIDARNYSTTRLRLFCSGTDRAHSTNLMLQASGNRVIAGLEAGDGQLESQFQSNGTNSGTVAVRLLVKDRAVEIYLDGIMVGKIPSDPRKRAGAGLAIEPASLWGNQVRPIALSSFSTPSSPGATWVPDINPKTRLEALTVPRFRKDNPPQHALVAANGDVLRGEIAAATLNFFEFRSGLETLRVPRDRVRAAIWLKKPDPSAPTVARADDPVFKLLDQSIERRMGFGNATFAMLMEFLQQLTGGELKYKLPEQEIQHRFRTQIGGQTIGEALEQMCNEAGVRYRVDDKGVVVIESTPQLTGGNIQKIYWLKPDAFPPGASAQDLLVAKGVPFPGGTAAIWQPRARQLTVTNTAVNQRKLSDVLATDFGGTLGSPTHWLLLTNGARMAIEVDLFGRDMVTGRHPVYGLCKIPVADIYAIRTQPPPPTPAMKTFEDWRLVYAPEPVIPESGGQSSPLIGKGASAFKLPLLEGGEFDLASEKGKVLVLDFWATWCGPCVKALPGVIETIAHFPKERVKLVGVNQGEPADTVKNFLEAHEWTLSVAMDMDQSVARQYGVDGIPHTVVIGPNGKVAWVKSGYSPDGDKELAAAIEQLLGGVKAP